MTEAAEARRLNQAIDLALADPAALPDLLRHARGCHLLALAERVRRRATSRARHSPATAETMLEGRDRLLLALYADAAPAGWAVAWCDASRRGEVATIGVLLRKAGEATPMPLTRAVGDLQIFEAEAAAVVAAVELALAHGVTRLRVYSDCKALVTRWLSRADDARLQVIRQAAADLERFQLFHLPPRHNPVAHRLARTHGEKGEKKAQ